MVYEKYILIPEKFPERGGYVCIYFWRGVGDVACRAYFWSGGESFDTSVYAFAVRHLGGNNRLPGFRKTHFALLGWRQKTGAYFTFRYARLAFRFFVRCRRGLDFDIIRNR